MDALRREIGQRTSPQKHAETGRGRQEEESARAREGEAHNLRGGAQNLKDEVEGGTDSPLPPSHPAGDAASSLLSPSALLSRGESREGRREGGGVRSREMSGELRSEDQEVARLEREVKLETLIPESQTLNPQP